MNNKILLVDHDSEFTEQLKVHLISEQFEVQCAHDGESGIKIALNQSIDAVIMEILLPEKNGFEVIKAIREFSQTPIVVLSARTDDIDRIIALELGADDYLNKPCNPRELTARLRAILRRTHGKTLERPTIHFDNLTVDCAKRQVLVDTHSLELTNTEFNILEILIKAPGQAFSKEELTEYGLGRDFTAYDRSIDVHISNLRNKLGHNHQDEEWIKTVRGFGYMFTG